MSGSPNTIIIEGADYRSVIREALADEAFTPGELLERTATGVKKHATSAGNSNKIFALENTADARDIDGDYAAGETARHVWAERGQKVYAFVPAAAAAVADGVALMSNGDGTLIIAAVAATLADTDHIVAYASEAVDNSGGGTKARIQVEVA